MKKIVLILIFLFCFIKTTSAETLIEDGSFPSIYNFIDNDGNLVLIPKFWTNNLKIFSNSWSSYIIKSPDVSLNTSSIQDWNKWYIVFDSNNVLIFVQFMWISWNWSRYLEMFVINKNTQQYYYTFLWNVVNTTQCVAMSNWVFIFGNNCVNDYYYIDFSMIFNPDLWIWAWFGKWTNTLSVVAPLLIPINISWTSFKQFLIYNNSYIISCSINNNTYNQYNWSSNFWNSNHNSLPIDTIDFNYNNLCTINHDTMSNISSFSYFNQTNKILNSKIFVPWVGFQWYTDRYIDRLENSWTWVLIKWFQNKSWTLYRDINGSNTQISVTRDYTNNYNPYYYKQDTAKPWCTNVNYCIYVNIWDNPITAPPSTWSGNIINNSDVTVNLSPNINNVNNNNIDVNIPTDAITNSWAVNVSEFGSGSIANIMWWWVNIWGSSWINWLFNNTISWSTNKTNNCSNIMWWWVFQYAIWKNNNFFQLKLENVDTQKMIWEANWWKLEFFWVNFLKPLYAILDFFWNFAVKIYNYIISSIDRIIDLFWYIFNNVERNKYYCYLWEEYYIYSRSTQYKSYLDNTIKSNNWLLDIIVAIWAIISNIILLIKLRKW